MIACLKIERSRTMIPHAVTVLLFTQYIEYIVEYSVLPVDFCSPWVSLENRKLDN